MCGTLARPIITYAFTVWLKKAQPQKAQKKLNKLPRLTWMHTTRAISTAPTAALEVLLNLPALYLALKKEASKAVHSYLTNNNRVQNRVIHKALAK